MPPQICRAPSDRKPAEIKRTNAIQMTPTFGACRERRSRSNPIGLSCRGQNIQFHRRIAGFSWTGSDALDSSISIGPRKNLSQLSVLTSTASVTQKTDKLRKSCGLPEVKSIPRRSTQYEIVTTRMMLAAAAQKQPASMRINVWNSERRNTAPRIAAVAMIVKGDKNPLQTSSINSLRSGNQSTFPSRI